MEYGTEYKTLAFKGKKRVNVSGVLFSLLIPWVIFCSVTAVLGFAVHPALAAAVIIGSVGVVLTAGVLAFRRWRSGDAGQERMWYPFLAVTSLLALVAAYCVGVFQWKSAMSGVMHQNNLNTYYHVDPARMRGQQIMDGGLVKFVEETFVDVSKSAGFRNDGTYCVAPITSVKAPLASYDFWAVGRNCCPGLAADFKCGTFNREDTEYYGARLLEDSERPFYRLAVQQAQATHGIRSDHPLFFKYIEDPETEASEKYVMGWRIYFAGMLGYFGLQLALVCGALWAIGKL